MEFQDPENSDNTSDGAELEPSPPEQRLVKTKLSGAPKIFGLHIGMTLILLSLFVSLWTWKSQEAYESLSVSGQDFKNGIPMERLFTALFVHGDWGHFFSNSYMLLILSIFVFGTLTTKWFYAALMAGVFILASMGVSVLTLESYPLNIRLIGISGMVYMLAGFWLVNFMWIERTLSFGARTLRALGVGAVIFWPTTFEPNVSYMAHAYGMLIGVVLGGIYFFLFRRWIRSFEVYRWV